MKKLLKEAPGTYQHSMAVAYLAHSVGEAIGANSLLLRIGAYYHDIGKMETPKNFIENQYNSENPHDVLDPWESTELIINHVKHGTKIGMGSRLPRALVDLILQHHGTQRIEYFYGIAAKSRLRLDKMVQLIVGQRIADGQFSECDLTTRDISKIVRALADALEASLHSRIRYPWQEKTKVKKRTHWTFGIGEKEPEARNSFKL
jgi:putative nucleotidyltransferase with HDIG domain